jgi:hypothetical protein
MINFYTPMYFKRGDKILTHLAENRDGHFTVMKACEYPSAVIRWKAQHEARVSQLLVPPCRTYADFAAAFIDAAELRYKMPFVPWVMQGDPVPTEDLATLAMLKEHTIPERFLTGYDVELFLIGGEGKPHQAPAQWLENRRHKWTMQKQQSAVSYIVDQAFQAFGKPQGWEMPSAAGEFVKQLVEIERRRQGELNEQMWIKHLQANPLNGLEDLLPPAPGSLSVYPQGLTPPWAMGQN